MIRFVQNEEEYNFVVVRPYLSFEGDRVYLMVDNLKGDSNIICTLTHEGTLELAAGMDLSFGFQIDKNGYIKVVKD